MTLHERLWRKRMALRTRAGKAGGIDKAGLVDRILARAAAGKPDNVELRGACLYMAAATVEVLGAELLGYRPVLQAGSASWRRLRDDQDDGKPTTYTHFSYVFDPTSPETVNRYLKGLLPEMHCWVGLLPLDNSEPELVDVTGKFLVDQCRGISGMDWPGDQPPPFYWFPGSEAWKYKVHYEPSRVAIALAYEFLDKAPLKPAIRTAGTAEG